MKNLKIKKLFLSLVTVALLGILVTSCEREVITTVLESEVVSAQNPELVTDELPAEIESRTCKFDGCKYYIRSLTTSQVKASSKAPHPVYALYYGCSNNYLGYQRFTPLSQTCSFVTYNLSPPAGTSYVKAFVYSQSCGVAQTVPAC